MSEVKMVRDEGWLDDRPDPLWTRASVRHWSLHRALGLEVVVSTNAERLGRLAVEAFGPALDGGYVDRDAVGTVAAVVGTVTAPGASSLQQAIPARADLRFRLIEGPPTGGDGWPDGRANAANAGSPVLREDGALFAAWDGGGGIVVADLEQGTATAWVPAGAPSDRVRRILLESPLWRLATWRGLLAVHAAAVVVDGVAVLVRGASGAGKSSVAIAADVAGHAVLAEEVAWIDPVRWTVWPLAHRAHVVDGPSLRRALGRGAAEGEGEGEDDEAAFRSPRVDTDTGKLAVGLLVPRPTAAVTIGPLVLLDPPEAPNAVGIARDERGSARSDLAVEDAVWTVLTASAARARFEGERIIGEHAQPAGRWDAVCTRLCADGAFALRGGDPRARVAALARIVEAWRGEGDRAARAEASR